ncbi:MAG: type II toxin-antitoxin system HigB family toxin [Methylocystaceae bacterium]|nr:type II toxin-antitoxin system HigB family toxin [Methylocystaceae bacterium]
MNVIKYRSLKEYWDKHPQTQKSLKFWHAVIRKAQWQSMNDVQQAFSKCKTLNNERVHFEVAGGDFRLIAAFDFSSQTCWIQFSGTHTEYDRIDALSVHRF